jgi:hypothetical protein
MSAPLDAKIVIAVFGMKGCPACKDYLPRLYQQIEGYQKMGHPFVVYQDGMELQPNEIPVLVFDAQSPGVQEIADLHQVKALPTTLLMPKVGYAAKYEGSLSNQDIYNLLNVAILSNR